MHGFYFCVISICKTVFNHIDVFLSHVKEHHRHRHDNNLQTACLIKVSAFAIKVKVLWSKGAFLTVNNIHNIQKPQNSQIN